ncbi:MAG: hypothetical protein HYY22_00340 [Thaumarchaeota archaeon]|nr:hypothetical protein [Nitrososphaerota archaeon]
MVVFIKPPSEEYKQKIAAAITESMAHLLGENGTKMVFFYAGLKLVDLNNLDPNEVYDRLGDLIPCLRKIFGPGSMLIERQITTILTAAESEKQNSPI